MKRILSTFAICKQTYTMLGHTKLINDFKEFKFKSPPSYSELPINDNLEFNIPVAVNNSIFSKVPTEPLEGKLDLVCASDEALADILDLDPNVANNEDFVNWIAGKYLPEGALSVSHRYGGYQFGYWADQLGDGRAHILGEYINRKGELWQIQLKGSGETPYSRFADGRAVLRSSIREMIASEACYNLGMPTTRAAGLVVSDTHKVWRDKTYSGMAKQERAAIVMRLAPAWYRIGSFEILYKRREIDLEAVLADFIIQHHFPDINILDSDRIVKLFSEVAYRNLDMVATWQGFGFTHGVLNTDNISLLGLTIDYGPFGFMEHYYQHYVPNSSDDRGRYAYNMQPEIILWNLDKLLEALVPILTPEQICEAREIQRNLENYIQNKIRYTFNKKLGLDTVKDGDDILVKELLDMLQETNADFSASFRQLAEVKPEELLDTTVLESKWSLSKVGKAKHWEQWVHRYTQRLADEQVSESDRTAMMKSVNPLYIPRNWILQEAIADAENNDFQKVRHLLEVFKNPFEINEEAEKLGYSSQPPSWSYGLKLSCSS